MLSGNNGILTRATEAKKLTDESQITENIALAYNSAIIGKYTSSNEDFANKMQEELEKTYGTGNATVTNNGNGTFTFTVNGKIYDIAADGNITKQGVSIVVGETTFVLKDSNGQTITTPKIQGDGTVEIHFTASLAEGTISSVTANGLTPSLVNGEWVTEVTANGTYSFNIAGTVDGETKTTSKTITVNQFSNIPSGLKIGSTVTYSPSGTYSWKAKYASSDLAVTKTENDIIVEDTSNDVLLNSANGESFRITTWKVLSIDEDTEEIQLIPSTPTTGTVRLQGPQGYNNAVKLLNDACDALYSTTKNGTKVIEARSINIEDFEGKFLDNNTRVGGVLTDAAIAKRDAYNNSYTGSNCIEYGYRYTTEYSTYRDSSGNFIYYKKYPLIYGLEADSIIDEELKDGTLGLSSQTSFIKRLDENLVSVAEEVTNATSIRPKQTYYDFGTDFNSFKSYFKNYENNGTKSYADLLSPNGSSTSYWVASRCVHLYVESCYFKVRNVKSGCFSGYSLCNSWFNNTGNSSLGLFPVVSLSSELISPDTQNAGQFKVE